MTHVGHGQQLADGGHVAADFVTRAPENGISIDMANPQTLPSAGATQAPRQVTWADADLERELRQAEEDFARGDYIELTVEQLEHCAATGESPWPDEPRT